MNTAKDIEKAIESLPVAELKEFRIWFEKFDSENWDRKIVADAKSGKLDDLARTAISAHRSNKTKEM